MVLLQYCIGSVFPEELDEWGKEITRTRIASKN
jgi:hypothetical protein